MKELVENEPVVAGELEFSISIEQYEELMLNEWRKHMPSLKQHAEQVIQHYDELLL